MIKKGWALFFIILLFVSATLVASGSSDTAEGLLIETGNGRTITLEDGTIYPNRQIELIVPLKAGGGTDVFCRQLASSMYKIMGQPVVINNIDGASGLRGIGVALNAKPDGYTLVASNPPGEQIAYLSQKPDYDMSTLTPIAGYSSDVICIIARSDFPYNTLPELVNAYQNGEISVIGTPGKGDAGHIAINLVKQQIGLDFKTVITYGGSGDVVAALLRDEIDVGVVPSNAFITAYTDGEIKPIVALSDERFPSFPDLPSYGADYGYPSIESLTILSRCIFAPPGLPREIQEYLSSVIEEAIQDPELISFAESRKLPVIFSNSDEVATILSSSLSVDESIDLNV